jgi:hypothetical protein
MGVGLRPSGLASFHPATVASPEDATGRGGSITPPRPIAAKDYRWAEPPEVNVEPEAIRRERDRVVRQLAELVARKRAGLPIDPDHLDRLKLDMVVLDDLADLARRQRADAAPGA